jgi:hypothetical protein
MTTPAPKLIEGYLAAFNLANPGSEAPHVTYNKGWFEFRYGIDGDGGRPSRYRHAEMIRMTGNLVARVAEMDAANLEKQDDDFAYLESGLVE